MHKLKIIFLGPVVLIITLHIVCLILVKLICFNL